MVSTLLRRIAVIVVTGVVVLLLGAPTAAAHVTVHSAEATTGGFAEIAFRVPTESTTASTVKVEVAFPADHPLESVSIRPQPGWSYRTGTNAPAELHAEGRHHGSAAEAVTDVEWTAANADAAVKPGEYQEFRIAAGPLPEVGELVFKVVQTYSDGEVVRWIETPTPDGSPLDHPAPVLSYRPVEQQAAPVVEVGTPAAVWWAFAAAAVALVLALGSAASALRRRR